MTAINEPEGLDAAIVKAIKSLDWTQAEFGITPNDNEYVEVLKPLIELERLKSGRDVLVWSTGGIAEFTEEGKEAIPAKIADLDTRIQAIERSE